jgi:ferredoxin-NADP reductase
MTGHSPKPIHRVTTVVRSAQAVATDVIAYDLADPDGWDLPPFSAGSHIDVHAPGGGLTRQYSLYGDPGDRKHYRIAIKREAQGRGGSQRLQAELTPGTPVLVSLPRNLFPLGDGPHHVMIAGGIGITPFLSMIPEIRRRGQTFELHHCARDPEAAPFVDLAREIGGAAHVKHCFSRRGVPAGRIDVEAIIGNAPANADIYVCGPADMIRDALAKGGAACGERFHYELFGGTLDGTAADAEYVVELARSNRVIPVRQGQTMLAALREAGVEMNASCEAGVCLECKTRYLDGQPVHRDLTMPAQERGRFVTPCVSGCAGERLVLDI